MRNERSYTPTSPHLVFGLAIMAWGLLLVLDNFGVLDAERYWKLWPLILVAVGVARLFESARAGGPLCTLSGGLITIVGLALLLHNLDVVSFRQIWPLILLAAGGGIVWKALAVRGKAAPPQMGDWREGDGLGRGSRLAEEADRSHRLEAFTIMGGVHRRTTSQAFTGGAAMAVMGGCEIDLRQAALANGRATFDTFAMWGGIEIRVPEDWEVESHVVPLLGGFEDKTHPPAGAKERLVVTGVAIMGGVVVKN